MWGKPWFYYLQGMGLQCSVFQFCWITSLISSGISRENAVSEKISPWFPTKTTFVTVFEIESCFRSLQIPYCQASMELMHNSSTVHLLEITSSTMFAMAIWVIKFTRKGYKIKWSFGQKSTH